MSTSRSPNAAEFRAALSDRLGLAENAGKKFLEVRSGDFHREMGHYPGPGHTMPTCCNVMYAEMQAGDVVLRTPPKGQGANLVIRYLLPRP